MSNPEPETGWKRSDEMECPQCKKPMKNLGNMTGIIMTSNPPQWTDTYVCDPCRIQINKRCSGQPNPEPPDLAGYFIYR